MEFTASNPNDPERVTSLKWTDSDGVQTANLAASGGSSCGEPVEFFGQSYGSAGGFVVARGAGAGARPAGAAGKAAPPPGGGGGNAPLRTPLPLSEPPRAPKQK